MNITLLGYGKMGKEIEKIAISRGHTIAGIIGRDTANRQEILNKSDCVIEFTEPNSAIANFKECFSSNVPVVTGTTGWYNSFDEVVKECKESNGTIFYASNFSVGVNVLFHVNQVLAKIMNSVDGYRPSMTEVHHIHKKDSPSGTALTLAQGVIENLDSLNGWEETESEMPSEKSKLPIKALRENEVPGIHEIRYESEVDFIEIKHSAKNRTGFALGSVLAAEWVYNKKGVFTMSDMLQFN